MYSQIAKAGTTKHLRKLQQAARNREKGKTGVSYRSYCPHCNIPDLAHPQTAPHVTVGDIYHLPHTVSCAAGHAWKVLR